MYPSIPPKTKPNKHLNLITFLDSILEAAAEFKH